MFISFCYFALQVFINFAKNQSDILPSEEDSTTNVSAPGTWWNVLEFDFFKTEQINMSFLCHLHGTLGNTLCLDFIIFFTMPVSL